METLHIYTRVSTTAQEEGGTSLETQKVRHQKSKVIRFQTSCLE